MRSRLIALVLAAALGAAAGATDMTGDPSRGAEVFSLCKGCHQVGEGARNRVGPHLNGLFGRTAGSLPEFRYSNAMQRASADGLVWTADTLDAFIENPKSIVSRNRMSYRGLQDAGKRADLLAFLRAHSDNPGDIPEAAPTAARTDHDVDPKILALTGDPEFGEYLSSECTTCHQADGADDGIPSITNWPTDDFVSAMHAYKAKKRPHPVMQMMAGRLSNEEIAALAAYFETIQ